MKNVLNALFLCACVVLCGHTTAAPRMEIGNPRTEYLANPIGIDTPTPRLSWEIVSDKPFEQTAYQVSVATSVNMLNNKKSNVWNSGKVKSSNSMIELPASCNLTPHTQYFWKVVAYDSKGNQTASPVSSFETGKMSNSDWIAKWITDQFDREFRKAPMIRKKIEIQKNVAKARLYVSAAGYYEMEINGTKVGDHLLDPGYTHFDKRLLYVTHDITSMLQKGDNAVCAVLGNGWYNIQSLAVWEFHDARWRGRPSMMCELRITYDDGTTEVIGSDKTWMTNSGPYIFNNLYSGDVYDARLEKTGWTRGNYDDSKWAPATEVNAPAQKIVAQAMAPIRVTAEYKPVEMRKFNDCLYVYDMGINMAGVCRLKVTGVAGTKITIKHGEMISGNGRLNQGNIDVYFQRTKNGQPQHLDPNETFQTDTYYLKGDSEETFTPAFTYHGFQYVEIESSKPIKLEKESLTGLFVHTDVESVGSFSCSNDDLNKLVAATRQSYLSNLHSIPTDCPQREKNGWTADGFVSMDLALLNFDGIKVYEKWLNDFIDNQREKGNISGIIPSSGWGYADWIGPVWDAGMFIIADKIYNYYGDKRIIENIYPTCVKYLEYLKTREENGILTFGIGDWVFYKAQTPKEYTSTALYWLDNMLMAKFATLTGNDASAYSAKADKLKQIINEKWYNPKTGIYSTGTQAAQAVALGLGFTPKGEEQKVADRLVEMIRKNNHHLDFGLLGSKYVTRTLSKYGYAEDAYKMVTKEDDPSWTCWMRKGMTTLPETWVLDEQNRDASLNHVFMGDVSAWFVNDIAGINYDELNPGFKHIILRPHFISDLQWAKAEYNSVKGLISSHWKREGGKVILTVQIPANTTATLYLDKPVELKPGTHTFTVTK